MAAVVAYHAGLAAAPGGFLGVDVFFALSGYLITALLLQEWAVAGAIDLAAFWVRRVRRLVPALVLVLVAVGAYAAWLADPVELERIRGDGLGTLLYVANWRMIFSGESYFEGFAAPSPLRHAWSLAIEEQWYVVWPVAIALVLRVARGRRSPVVLVTVLGAAASALVMAVLASGAVDPSRAYYGTDARAQGLLAGAALAVLLHHGWAPRRRASAVAVQAAGAAGLAAVAALVALASDADAWLYRGGFAAVAVATCAVLLAGVQPAGAVRAALSWPPLVALGRVSYGVYLWHWPVFVALTPSRTGLTGPALLTVRLAATGLLTMASYHLVEQPVRTGRVRVPRPAAVLPAVAASVAFVLVAATVDVAPRVTAAPVTASPAAAAVVAPGAPRVLVVGDSVAMTLAAEPPPGVAVTSEAILGCGVVRTVRFAGPRAHVPADDCRRWPQRWSEAVGRVDPDVALLLVGAWEVFDVQLDGRRVPFGAPEHETLVRAELGRALDVLAAGGARVVALTAPCFDHRDDDLFRSGSERNDPARVAWVNHLLVDEAGRRPGVEVVDLHAMVCPGGEFHRELGGVPLRAGDGVHFQPEGARLVLRELLTDIITQ